MNGGNFPLYEAFASIPTGLLVAGAKNNTTLLPLYNTPDRLILQRILKLGKYYTSPPKPDKSESLVQIRIIDVNTALGMKILPPHIYQDYIAACKCFLNYPDF